VWYAWLFNYVEKPVEILVVANDGAVAGVGKCEEDFAAIFQVILI